MLVKKKKKRKNVNSCYADDCIFGGFDKQHGHSHGMLSSGMIALREQVTQHDPTYVNNILWLTKCYDAHFSVFFF